MKPGAEEFQTSFPHKVASSIKLKSMSLFGVAQQLDFFSFLN